MNGGWKRYATGLFLSFLGVVLAVAALLRMRTWTSYQPTLSSMFPKQQIVIPTDWNTEQTFFNEFDFTLTFRYPSNWFHVEAKGGGHPNYITLFSPDMHECVKVSVSQDYKNIDNEIGNAINQWANHSLPNNSVIDSENMTVHEKQGKMDLLNWKGVEFLIVVLDLNVDRHPDTVFVILSSCSLNERTIFYEILSSISVK